MLPRNPLVAVTVFENEAVVPFKVPVSVPPARGSFAAILFVIVVLKLASSPIAAASSFNVSKAPGALSTKFDT